MFNSKAPQEKNIPHPEKAPPVKHQKAGGTPQNINSDLNEIMRRLRVLEERYGNLRKKNQLSDQNMLEDSKKVYDEIRIIESTITELKREVLEVNTKIKMLEEEVSESVQKRDLKMISKYMDFWEPMQFVRREEAERIIEDIIKSSQNKKMEPK